MKKIIPFIIVLFSFLSAYLLAPYMPELMASHWGIGGQVDGYVSKAYGLFFMPCLSLFLYILFLFLPSLDPYKKNFKQFESYYDNFMIIVFSFLFYLYLLTLFWNLGYRFNMVQLFSPGFASLFYYAGVLSEHSHMNWFVGIRTPWTLSSPKVWKKTHMLGGKLFKISAAISLSTLFFPSLGIYFLLIPILITTTTIFIYSYLEYQKLPQHSKK